MNKLILISFTTLLFSCTTENTEYFSANYQSSVKLAAKNDKMIFIDFYTVWCGACKFFDKNIKHDSIFKAYMQKNFITLQIDAELEQNKEIVKKYNPNGYPTFIITDSKGEEIDRIGGLKENNPQKFLDLIGEVLMDNNNLESLQRLFSQHPDSLTLFRKIIQDELMERKLYKKLVEFSEYAISNSNDPLLIEEAKFYKAYSSIRDVNIQSPQLMIEYIDKAKNEQFIEYGFRELFYYYRSLDNIDSIKYYLDTLVSINSTNHLGYVRDYAKFLYKHDIDLEYAYQLTKEYSEYPGNHADHWTPYLHGHNFAKQGQLERGIKNFDDWMKKYSLPENFKNDYWQYKYYIDLMIHYEVSSTKAIQYAEKFELSNPNVSNKLQLAELYYLNGQFINAIDKINEIKTIIDDPKKKEEYDDLIEKYTVNR